MNIDFNFVDGSAREDIPDIYMVSVKMHFIIFANMHLELFPGILFYLQVRSLIEDIRDVRFHKVETNLEKFTASTVTVTFYS